MYVVLEVANNLYYISNIFGPFDTLDIANNFADVKGVHVDNVAGNGNYYHTYVARTLTQEAI